MLHRIYKSYDNRQRQKNTRTNQKRQLFKLLLLLFIIYYCYIIYNSTFIVPEYAPYNIGMPLFQEYYNGEVTSVSFVIAHLFYLIISFLSGMEITTIFTIPWVLLPTAILVYTISYTLSKNKLIASFATIIQLSANFIQSYSIATHSLGLFYLILALLIMILYLNKRISYKKFILLQSVCILLLYYTSYDVYPLYCLISLIYIILILVFMIIRRITNSTNPLINISLHNFEKKGIMFQCLFSILLLVYMDFIYNIALNFFRRNGNLDNFSEFITSLFSGGGTGDGAILTGGATYSFIGYILYGFMFIFMSYYLVIIFINKNNTTPQIDYLLLSCYISFGIFGFLRVLVGSTGFFILVFLFTCMLIPRIWILTSNFGHCCKSKLNHKPNLLTIFIKILLILFLLFSIIHAADAVITYNQNNYPELNDAAARWSDSYINNENGVYCDFTSCGLINMLLYQLNSQYYDTKIQIYPDNIIQRIDSNTPLFLSNYLLVNPRLLSAPATNNDWSVVYPYKMSQYIQNFQNINIIYQSPLLLCK